MSWNGFTKDSGWGWSVKVMINFGKTTQLHTSINLLTFFFIWCKSWSICHLYKVHVLKIFTLLYLAVRKSIQFVTFQEFWSENQMASVYCRQHYLCGCAFAYRERERVCMCVCQCVRACVCVCVCVSVCVLWDKRQELKKTKATTKILLPHSFNLLSLLINEVSIYLSSSLLWMVHIFHFKCLAWCIHP